MILSSSTWYSADISSQIRHQSIPNLLFDQNTRVHAEKYSLCRVQIFTVTQKRHRERIASGNVPNASSLDFFPFLDVIFPIMSISSVGLLGKPILNQE